MAACAVVCPVPPFASGSVPDTSAESDTAAHEGLPAAFPCRTVVAVPWFTNAEEASASETAPVRPFTDVTDTDVPTGSQIDPL